MKKNKRKKKLLILFSLLQVISGSTGLYLAFFGNNFMTENAILYFTIQSNIVITIVTAIYLIKLLLNKKCSRTFNIIQLISTVGIALTFLVFAFMLTPQFIIKGHIEYLISVANISVHLLSPIFAILVFILSPNKLFKKYDFLYGTFLPIFYLLFCIHNDLFIEKTLYVNIDGNASRMPYFFMNYHKIGWLKIGNSIFELGFVYWILILSIIVILISIILKYLNKKIKY